MCIHEHTNQDCPKCVAISEWVKGNSFKNTLVEILNLDTIDHPKGLE